MRHSFYTLFVLILFVLPSKAQIGEYRSEFAIGCGGGMVLSKVGFIPEVPQNMRKGVMGGISFRYTCEKYFSSICAIAAEANIAQLGWKESILTRDNAPVINSVTGLPEEYERAITYLQVPVFARLGWGRERKGFQFFFQAGPQIGFCLGEKTTSNFEIGARNTAQRTSQIFEQDTMSVERNFDYGIAAGLGLEFSHPKVGHFLLEGRYYYGLGDMYDNSKRGKFGRSANQTLMIKLTYLFDLVRTKNSQIK